jgi:predicted dinucleotide-binding enzyme
VVKAFNTVFAIHMDSGKIGGQSLTAFVAGTTPGPKAVVLGLARSTIGFDPVDAGPLENARLLEPHGAPQHSPGVRPEDGPRHRLPAVAPLTLVRGR